LKRAGFRIRYVNFGRHPDAQPTLDGYAGLIVLGGPMSVYDVDAHPHLVTEVALIRDALARELPVLGICLGAQLIAKALGARVRANPQKEIGWYDVSVTELGGRDPLLAGFQPCERLFQWHGDTFELPDAAVHLASSASCDAQAFRYGRNVYGFQFHLEVDQPLIGRWLQVPVHRQELAELAGIVDPEQVRAETRQRIARSIELSRQTFQAFVDLFELPPKRELLRSR